MSVQTDSQPLLTTQQKEWHYIYFTCKKVNKVPPIMSHFKNDTMSTKNYLVCCMDLCSFAYLLNQVIVPLVDGLH